MHKDNTSKSQMETKSNNESTNNKLLHIIDVIFLDMKDKLREDIAIELIQKLKKRVIKLDLSGTKVIIDKARKKWKKDRTIQVTSEYDIFKSRQNEKRSGDER